ncbi:putative serine threonine protein kinase protein [Neofusicoccum parvum UCRNP2]|uniref:non-specific serine/threonine protein kinase n=1 Tax=Botryosphaeria parva (strain UCR-NP2) TaxID=1287680 RepID=R1GRN6_BOTPV|nr:putative serine threonine protein kinase protein [Neofusicoccum parvum UCRNP2]
MESRRNEYLREWRPGNTLAVGGTARYVLMVREAVAKIIVQRYCERGQPLPPHEFTVCRLLKRGDPCRDADLIVDMFEWYPDTPNPGECTILTPRANDDLCRWIERRCRDPNGAFYTPDERLLRHIFLELAKAVAFMHSGSDFQHHRCPGFVHRDIKPGNVLVFTDPDDPDLPALRLADLGSAREVGASRSSDGEDIENIFTPGYSPPEFGYGRSWTTDCDVFSLGATIHYCAFRRTPYIKLEDTVAGLSDHHMGGSVLEPVSLRGRGWREGRDGPVLSFSDGFADILVSTLSEDPDQRPSATELVEILGQLRPGRPKQVVSRQVKPEPEWV